MGSYNHLKKFLFFSFVLLINLLLLISISSAQTPVVDLPMPDNEGWIRLYDGTNDSVLFTQYGGFTNNDFPDATFTKGDGDTISVTGRPSGTVQFKQEFSHYKLKFQFHYPNNSQGNSGLLFHIQDGDPKLGVWPRSLESQGDPNQGMGQLWCISRIWVDITLRNSTGPGGYFGDVPIYDPSQPERTYGRENDQGGRVAAGIEGWKQPTLTQQMNDTWVEMEVDVHGSDSISHSINGKVMIRYKNPRVADTFDPDQVDNVVSKKLSKGKFAWQSEGVAIMYRNFYVKLYPEDPLYDHFYPTSVSPNFEFADLKVSLTNENQLLIKGKKSSEYNLNIRNIRGDVVIRNSFQSNKSISMLGYPVGMYLVQLESNKVSKNFKILVD